MKCPECGIEIGKKVGIDIYKHAVACLHLQDQGAQKILDEVADQKDERSNKIKALMQAALKGE